MIFDVVRYQITVDYVGYPNWIVPRLIVVQMDDSTYTLSVIIRNGSGATVESPVAGPDLYQGLNGHSTPITSAPYYQWCDGTTLNKVSLINIFPYATITAYPGSSECTVAPVCDLEISNIVTVTPATDPDSADGEIQVSATSSNGTIKYDLDPDFDYTTGMNTSGLFTGLLPATYTIYAKDSVGCLDTLEVVVTVTTEYAPLFVGEYDSIKVGATKIEILQRGYDGVSTEVKFSGTPFVLDYDDCDKFTPFVASNCTIEFLEETEDQFQDLFTSDDRKYRVDYYKFIGVSYVLIWTGYVIPEYYSKPFVREADNYVTVRASDQLGILKSLKFLDSGGNTYRGFPSQLELITEALKTTGLEINIRCADTIYEEGMDTDEDPLTQAFIDVRIFYDEKGVPKKWDEVLQHVIKCKSGLRLFQSLGVWWLVRSEDNVGTFNYREFDLTGDLIDEASYSPVVDRTVPTTNGINWVNASQIEMFDTNYGAFNLINELAFDDNLIDEGRFEAEDIIDLANGNKTFKNWSVTQAQAGLNYGLELVSNGNSKGAFYADFDHVFDDQADNLLYSIEIPIESDTYADANLIKFKFDVNVFPTFNVPWIRIGWSVRLTDSFLDYNYLQGVNGWNDSNEIVDLYVDKFGTFQTVDITAAMPNQADLTGTVRICFFFHNHVRRDFDSITDLKAFPTDDVEPGKRFLVFDGATDYTYFYELIYGRDVESSPDNIRPNDWDLSTNPKTWILKGKAYIEQYASLVNKILFDNVQLSYVPFDPITSLNFEPPEEAEYFEESDAFNKLTLEDTFLLGDLPEIENGKNLYRGYLRLADGTPTAQWFRNGISESKKLLALALSDRVAQLGNPVKKIQSDVLMNSQYYNFVDCLEYNGERYLNGKFTMSDKDSEVTLNLLKMETGPDGSPPVLFGSFSSAFGHAYDSIL
jgi:hypothetical protein